VVKTEIKPVLTYTLCGRKGQTVIYCYENLSKRPETHKKTENHKFNIPSRAEEENVEEEE
jgi:hypothetical protein